MTREIAVEVTVYERGRETTDLFGPVHLRFETNSERPLKAIGEEVEETITDLFSTMD